LDQSFQLELFGETITCNHANWTKWVTQKQRKTDSFHNTLREILIAYSVYNVVTILSNICPQDIEQVEFPILQKHGKVKRLNESRYYDPLRPAFSH
jgi:hypothetical protein